jgi:hypothetical protein
MKVPMLLLSAGVAMLLIYAVYKAPARAQGSGGALVVTTCGTLPGTYAVGATRSLTVNTNGQVCQ